ncbi:MAG: S41 family peptidase [Hyphomicrobiaceae bacterium]
MTIIGCRGLAFTMLAAVLTWTSSSAVLAQSGNRPSSASQRAVSLEARLELMLRTMRIARDWHIEAPRKSALIAGAIEGLLARVDPEAELYTREDLRRVARFVPGGGAGVGLDIRREPAERRQERKGYRIVAARDAGPAARAGLKAGDLVTHVDGEPVGELPYLVMTHAVLEGVPGTSVRLTVERKGTDRGAEEVTLERSQPRDQDVTIDEVISGVSRVRIAALSGQTGDALARSWARHRIEGTPARTRGVVIDLRSTAATDLDGARAVADAFLQSGPIVRLVSRRDAIARRSGATPGDLADGRPIVVLVDGGTAGAAEVLASALQEGRRARIVGMSTAGRGALRQLVTLGRQARNGNRKVRRKGETRDAPSGLLRLTTERLVTPAGAPIEGKGIAPDVVIEQLPAVATCRPRDMEDASNPGLCVARPLAQDTQLQRAISLLDEPLVAAKEALAPAKP